MTRLTVSAGLIALCTLFGGGFSAPEKWVHPQGFPSSHNGGFMEKLVAPVAGKQPHILMILFDDYGWADAGWHRNYTGPGGAHIPPTVEVQTPNLNALVHDGIELDRNYVYKFCSPTRSALQSGRNPYHVNPLNAAPEISNPNDPVSGFAAVPRNMTGIATKLASAGYKTAMFGKWDAGMATPDHTPHGRGYHTALSYFHHCNDYWSMTDGANCQDTPIVDLWQAGSGAGEGPAHGLNNTCATPQPMGGQPAQCKPGPNGDTWWGGYEDSLFEQHVIQTIDQHDPSSPLFVFWAPHIVHTPLQVPQHFIDKFDFIQDDTPHATRKLYHAMVNFADEALGNITTAYKNKNMWEDLLIVFSTDNGGPIYGAGTAGANNFPLKGGKMNNWEGGIRGNGFVSGGFVPTHQRGSKWEGLVTAWDWYHTFASFAGVDPQDHRAKSANLPPIDSYDMSQIIMGKNLTSPRSEIAIGTEPRQSNVTSAPLCSSYSPVEYYDDPRIVGDEIQQTNSLKGKCTTVSGLIWHHEGVLWKLLTGVVEQSCYTGPHYPNASTKIPSNNYVQDCANGCLFNLHEDPLETNDLASDKPMILTQMYDKLVEYEKTAFNPHRGQTNPEACKRALGEYKGFWGPFVK